MVTNVLLGLHVVIYMNIAVYIESKQSVSLFSPCYGLCDPVIISVTTVSCCSYYISCQVSPWDRVSGVPLRKHSSSRFRFGWFSIHNGWREIFSQEEANIQKRGYIDLARHYMPFHDVLGHQKRAEMARVVCCHTQVTIPQQQRLRREMVAMLKRRAEDVYKDSAFECGFVVFVEVVAGDTPLEFVMDDEF